MTINHRLAIELARQGDWDAAHTSVQHGTDEFSCAIHACLHRIEGDLANANYWYRRAGLEPPRSSTEQELEALYEQLQAAQR